MKELNINNWIYHGDCIADFKITPPDNIMLPKSLCRYYSSTKNSIDALCNNYLYINHPTEFNDPYDCVRQLSYIGKDAFWGYQLDMMYLGFVCMSESENSMLMWAHYSGHNGFMVNFKTTKLDDIFTSINPINYINTLPSIDKTYTGRALMISTNLKSKQWDYEKEWRCLKFTELPLEFPKSNRVLSKLGQQLFEQNNIKPIQRKLSYTLDSINFISLGYKFIVDEEHKSDSKNDIIEFNVGCPHKCKLLDFLIENKIDVRMTDFGAITEFEIINRPIVLSKINKEFRYRLEGYVA